jgi:phosphoglycolate phosphatase-like HAD superfamily hydrolase
LPYRALPAAAECVRAALAACELVGIATGNVERCAHQKLDSAGLGELFAGCVGGYGDDADARDDVVRVAIARARARGARAADVLVVGDTPRDVLAGHAAGARVAGVATGRFTAADLDAAGADHVYADLAVLLEAPPWP